LFFQKCSKFVRKLFFQIFFLKTNFDKLFLDQWEVRGNQESDKSSDFSNPPPRNLNLEKKLFSSQRVEIGINFEKYSNIPVEITDGAAEPINSLQELDFGEILNENIERMGYKNLTPIQQYGIPVTGLTN